MAFLDDVQGAGKRVVSNSFYKKSENTRHFSDDINRQIENIHMGDKLWK